jgi:hypothetical protein
MVALSKAARVPETVTARSKGISATLVVFTCLGSFESGVCLAETG